jgi:2-amino-4-hydroxy-6-hydroxymethyldihydropteridine diphosphokinase
VGNSRRKAIYIGLGGNLPNPQYGTARQTLEAALTELGRRGAIIRGLSPWYRSAPVPMSNQPWYLNAVAEIATDLSPDGLLAEMHAVEDAFGRVRSVRNAARVIDVDLIDFNGEIASGRSGGPILPHPRLTERAFVLRPLADIAPDWRHPVTGMSVGALVKALPADQVVERL